MKPTVIVLILVGAIAVGAGVWFFLSRPDAATNAPLANLSAAQNVNRTSPPVNAPTGGNGDQGDLTDRVNVRHVVLTGAGTQGLDVDPETGFVYLGNNGSVISKCGAIEPDAVGRNTLSIVDPSLLKEIARVPTDGAPIWPTVDVTRDVVYVASSGSSSVAVHRRGSGEKVESIALGGLPHMAGFVGNLLVVSNTFNQTQTYYSVVNLDTREVIANHSSPRLPHPIVVDPEATVAYMMGVEDAKVAVIDMTTGRTTATFTLEGGGGQLWMSKKFKKFYTSSSRPGTAAAAFDLTTYQPLGAVNFATLNQPGTSIVVDEVGGLLFVVVGDANAIGVADAQTLDPLGTIKVGGCPYAVRLDAERNLGFVSNSGDHSLSIFDLAKVRQVLGR